MSINAGDYVKVTELYATRTIKGVTFRVASISPKGVASLDPVNGGKGVRAPLDALEVVAPPAVSTIVPLVDVRTGSVVRVAGKGWREPAERLFVVTAVAVAGTVKIVPLGGSERDSYWPKIPISYLTVLDPSTVIAALATVQA